MSADDEADLDPEEEIAKAKATVNDAVRSTPPIQYLAPARVAVSLGSGSYQESLFEGHIDGVRLRDGDRVLICGPPAEAGMYEFQVSGRDRGALYPLDLSDNGDAPMAVFIREGEHEDVAFFHDPTEEESGWRPFFTAEGPFPLPPPTCLTDQAALKDIQTAAENWTPEAVARFLAVLHHRKHHDGGKEFSVELDEAMKNDTWTEE